VNMDLSMLELFRQEAAEQAELLETGLAASEGPSNPALIEPLMRAAHSIKGAARIVGLEPAVQLAHAMEDLLVEALQGRISLDRESMGVLLKATDMLKHIAAQPVESISDWLDGNVRALNEIKLELNHILMRLTASPGQEVTPSPEESEPDPEPGVPQTSASLSGFASDPSMLELFRQESASQAEILETGLVALENQSNPALIEPLMRAAHSIKGAARIVGLDPAVTLAHAMEDLLVAAQQGHIAITADGIDVLLKAADVFKHLADTRNEGLAAYLVEHQATLNNLEQNLSALLRGEFIEPMEETASCQAADAEIPALPTPDASTPSPPSEEVPATGGVVRVTADSLSRLMGLAGECLVQSRLLEIFSQDLTRLKNEQVQLNETLEDVHEALAKANSLPPLVGQQVSKAVERSKNCRQVLLAHIETFDAFWLNWENLVARLYNQAIVTRMRPLKDGLHGLPRLVRDAARRLGKQIRLTVVGEETQVDRDILSRLEAPLNHIIRNACDHGIETPEQRRKNGKQEEGTIRIEAGHRSGMLSIVISDDGVGIDADTVRRKVVEKGLATETIASEFNQSELMDFLFVPGFSTASTVTEISGRGVGLDVVRNMISDVRGIVTVESKPGQGARFQMQLPLTLSVLRTLLVEISGDPYAVPLTRIDRIVSITPEDIQVIEDRQYYNFDKENIGLVPANLPLGLPPVETTGDCHPVLIISDRLNRYGLVVDRILGERDLVVRPLNHRLGKIPSINAASILDDGSPVLIMDIDDLVRIVDNLLRENRLTRIGSAPEETETRRVKRILVVDDSITVREVERKILDNKGYQVDTAVDGMDGWNALRSQTYDLVITDVDMPRMNGLDFVRQIRSESQYRHLPIMMISYKEREEDRIRGLEVGANYYLTKSSFYDESFLNAVIDLIGKP
jgi:two-component system, chemotaxis family, sensor histidine kinase and response regulator WspE